MILFDYSLVYPRDECGCYIELDGYVTSIGEPLSDSFSVEVNTKLGTFTGYARNYFQIPNIGCRATIRIYDSGGGWYPDDRIVSLG